RGGNDNSGLKEGFFGEVNDLLAARDFLAQQSFVDPDRIYLGGHSTGGTMALLAAPCSDRFRAVFSFGPTDDVSNYGAKNLPFHIKISKEVTLRSPERWMQTIHCPTFVFEGTDEPSNIAALEALKQASVNSKVHFYGVPGATHFTILAPTTAIVANQILRDTDEECNIRFSVAELRKPFGK